jgi:beta-glucanase (GH16 family)
MTNKKLQRTSNLNNVEIIQKNKQCRRLFHTIAFICATSLMTSCNSSSEDIPSIGSFDKTGKWVLIWHDEFNYNDFPDSTKWTNEVGFIRNRELQYYTKENARVEDGVLVIEARKERIKNPRYHPDSTDWKLNREFAEYTSASINTYGLASFSHCRIEARIQVPHGSGVWPAFWTLGVNRREVNWPTCGEIDILEYFGDRPHRVESNMHYGIQGRRNHKQGVFETQGPPEGFNIYAIEWFNDRVDFYFNDNKYWSFPVDLANDGDYNSYRIPHYLLLNFALGGVPAAGKVDESLLPQKYLVDYVRVYSTTAH